MKLLQRTSFTILLFIFFLFGRSAYAAEPGLKMEVSTKDTAKPAVILTNTSSSPCQVAATSLGTVAVTKMSQQGQTLKPVLVHVSFDDGLQAILRHSLKTLKPQESVSIPLEVYPLKRDLALQTVTWSKATGAIGLAYQFKKNTPYTLELSYLVPIAVTGAPMCGSAASQSNSGFDYHRYLKPLIIICIILLIILIIWLVFRSKKNQKKATMAALFFIFLFSGMVRPVQADYSVPTDATGRFDECMALFDRYPDITGPILNDINDEHIIIFTNDVRVNDATDWPDGSYHVRWDPNSEYNYYSDDGSIIPSTPCDRLFHELYHVYEIRNHINDRTECAGSGIDTDEVNATRMQNRLREAMGLPPRTHYDEDRLPEGDCHPAPPPPSPGCGFSCAFSSGDPHVKTFDQKQYDFQAVGEFVDVTDPAGDFEVQTRQEPWLDSRYVSINTAVAMKVNKTRVEFRMENGHLTLLINGNHQTLVNKTLDEGATLAAVHANQGIVNWADGTKVTVTSLGIFGMVLDVEPAAARKGKLEGLMGNFNENYNDDLVIRGTKKTIEADYDKLYPTFANSWRVDDSSSLFTYTSGKTTASYTDKTFPDKYVNPNDLLNKEAAEQICKQMGVTEPGPLQNCIFDVGVTGRPEFAKAAALTQTGKIGVPNKEQTEKDFGGQKFTIELKKLGEIGTAQFTGKAHEKVFIALSNTTLPNQCGGFGIRNASNETIASGCIVSGIGFVDTTELPTDGTYSVFVQAIEANSGKATVQVIPVTDATVAATVNGPAVTAQLKNPGAVATVTFPGTAGQRVTVAVTTTLPNQCGGISLLAPDKTSIQGGCIIDGKGDFNETAVVLPQTGTYQFQVDPIDDKTGDITVKVTQ